jgi:hypothetical protein
VFIRQAICNVQGPDGALWFASSLDGGNTIGRITTPGVITQFPTAGDPKNITTGPDGALWFTEYNANKIGRLVLTANQELLITPTTDIAASGTQGVAFSPPSFSYTLSATGGVGFSISGVPSWLTASVASGTASSGTTVTFTVNASAAKLAANTYNATITFTNSTNGQGTQTRSATLTVVPQGSGTGGCSGNSPPTPATITAGQQTQLNVIFYCVDGPSYVADPVTIAIGKLPSGASFSPKTTTTDITGKLGTAITITTSKTTTVGTFTLQIGGTGKACKSYSANNSYCSMSFTVQPSPPAITCVTNSKVCPNLWWFNGVSPQPTNYVTTLQAPAGASDYIWTITSGAQYAQFSNSASTIDTKTTNTVKISPSADPGAEAPPTVTVTVQATIKGVIVTSNPFTLNLRKPYELEANGIVDKTDSTYGYQSQIHYRILDQTGVVMPFAIPLNENFTSGDVSDFPGANWTLPADCGTSHVCSGTYNPSDWFYLVQGAKSGSAPPSQHPPTTLGTTTVDHWSGTWGIGDGHPGAGVTVQTNTWQRFQDHARHANIVSPLP